MNVAIFTIITPFAHTPLFTSIYFIYMYAVIQSLHPLDTYTGLICFLSHAVLSLSILYHHLPRHPHLLCTFFTPNIFFPVNLSGKRERKLSTSITLLLINSSRYFALPSISRHINTTFTVSIKLVQCKIL